MPRDAAPAPIHDTISVVVDVNKLGWRLHSHDDQASGPLLLLTASICRSFPWLERLPQPARLDGLASQSRGCDALPYGHGGLLEAHFHRFGEAWAALVAEYLLTELQPSREAKSSQSTY